MLPLLHHALDVALLVHAGVAVVEVHDVLRPCTGSTLLPLGDLAIVPPIAGEEASALRAYRHGWGHPAPARGPPVGRPASNFKSCLLIGA